MAIGTYNIANHIKGDTFDGVQFTLQNTSDSLPIDLTGCLLKIQFRYRNKIGKVQKELNIGTGITLVDAVNGIFKIDPFIIDWNPDTYYYDVETTFTNGVVKTYIEGMVTIIQDTTNG